MNIHLFYCSMNVCIVRVTVDLSSFSSYKANEFDSYSYAISWISMKIHRSTISETFTQKKNTRETEIRCNIEKVKWFYPILEKCHRCMILGIEIIQGWNNEWKIFISFIIAGKSVSKRESSCDKNNTKWFLWKTEVTWARAAKKFIDIASDKNLFRAKQS